MRIRLSKRGKGFAVFNVVSAVLAATCIGVILWLSGLLDSLQAAQRWQGSVEMPFAQIACFMETEQKKTEEQILQFRRTLEQKLTENSLSAPENGSLYVDSWSAEDTLTVSSDYGSGKVRAFGVGGEFFQFHPLRLRSGSYLSQMDLMQDRVILDETLAWTLFGSPDVAGMTVYIEGKPFRVAGVVHMEDDFASAAAYGEGACMFLSYDVLHQLHETKIDCYEIILPNMISGFALGLMKESFDIGDGVILDNSTRYQMTNLLSVVKDFGRRSMVKTSIVYPYWENAVRMTEDWMALLLVLSILLLFCPISTLLVCSIYAVVKFVRYLSKKIPAAANVLIERRRESRYRKL